MNQIELNNKFIEACKAGDLKLAKKYHKMGADIHAYDDYALCMAVRNGHLHVIKHLVENGANIHTNDDWAICWATIKRYLHVVNYLREVDYGKYWKCYECIVRTTCSELCENYKK